MATPCCPAPVSAMMRLLPMRLASSAWPSALLILCAPVCVRSSRLRKMRAPPRGFGARRVGLVERRRPPDVVLQQVVELVAKAASLRAA